MDRVSAVTAAQTPLSRPMLRMGTMVKYCKRMPRTQAKSRAKSA